MKILFVGDVVGSIGRLMLAKHLPLVKKKYDIDFTIVNGENVTHGKGIIRKHYDELLSMGADVITLGNHYNAKGEIRDFIGDTISLIRPLNLKKSFPGVGTSVYQQSGLSIRVTNVLGQAFMNEEVLNPFDQVQEVIDKLVPTDLHIIDFHAEATGEKYAMGYAFSGKVTAVLGTHTHVQTNDARILEEKTAFISDVGMTGPRNGILGVKKEIIIGRLWRQEKHNYVLDDDGEAVMSAVVITVDDRSKLPIKIESIFIEDKVK
jgi:2',3'-cyclic-nucleotide 2'-phosphodiesterase